MSIGFENTKITGNFYKEVLPKCQGGTVMRDDFVLGSISAGVRAYFSWLYCGITPGRATKPYGMPGKPPRSAMYRVSLLLSLAQNLVLGDCQEMVELIGIKTRIVGMECPR